MTAIAIGAAVTFVYLFMQPARPNQLPQDIRVVPAW